MTQAQHSKISRAFEKVEEAQQILAELRDELGRSEEGRQVAILTTEAEKVKWQLRGVMSLSFAPSEGEDNG